MLIICGHCPNLFSTIMQSGMSVHDSATFMVMFIPGISSLSHGCVRVLS